MRNVFHGFFCLYVDGILLLIILLQSALQPLWVLACSTIIEYSQQEGLHRVPLPVAHQTPNLEDQWLERSNSCHQVSPTSETTRANPSSGRWNYGWEIAENFAENGNFHVTFLHAVNLRHGTDSWGFFCPKNPTALAGFEPANLGTRGQHTYL